MCRSRARSRRNASTCIRATPKAQRQKAWLSMPGVELPPQHHRHLLHDLAFLLTGEATKTARTRARTPRAPMKSRRKWSCCARSDAVIYQDGCLREAATFAGKSSRTVCAVCVPGRVSRTKGLGFTGAFRAVIHCVHGLLHILLPHTSKVGKVRRVRASSSLQSNWPACFVKIRAMPCSAAYSSAPPMRVRPSTMER